MSYEVYNLYKYPSRAYRLKVYEAIENAFNNYILNFSDKSFEIIFEDDSKLDFRIDDNRIFYLIGMNMKVMRQNYLMRDLIPEITTFEFLKELVKKKDIIVEKSLDFDKDMPLDFRKILIKASGFSNRKNYNRASFFLVKDIMDCDYHLVEPDFTNFKLISIGYKHGLNELFAKRQISLDPRVIDKYLVPRCIRTYSLLTNRLRSERVLDKHEMQNIKEMVYFYSRETKNR